MPRMCIYIRGMIYHLQFPYVHFVMDNKMCQHNKTSGGELRRRLGVLWDPTCPQQAGLVYILDKNHREKPHKMHFHLKKESLFSVSFFPFDWTEWHLSTHLKKQHYLSGNYIKVQFRIKSSTKRRKQVAWKKKPFLLLLYVKISGTNHWQQIFAEHLPHARWR